VFSRYDTSGGGPLVSSADVNAVLLKLNQAVGGACGPNYRYDTSLGGPLISSADVNAVLLKLNQSVTTACVN
jgi:CTP:molybdopterin cytidylyltransferase MocA